MGDPRRLAFGFVAVVVLAWAFAVPYTLHRSRNRTEVAGVTTLAPEATAPAAPKPGPTPAPTATPAVPAPEPEPVEIHGDAGLRAMLATLPDADRDWASCAWRALEARRVQPFVRSDAPGTIDYLFPFGTTDEQKAAIVWEAGASCAGRGQAARHSTRGRSPQSRSNW